MPETDEQWKWLSGLLMGFRNEIQRAERMIRLDGYAKTLPDIDMAVEVVKKAHEIVEAAIQIKVESMIVEARKDENQIYLDRINSYNPDITAGRFGSASGAIETAGWRQTFQDRLSALQSSKEIEHG